MASVSSIGSTVGARETAGDSGGSAHSGSVGIVRLGSFAKSSEDVGGTAGGGGGGSTGSRSVGVVALGSFAGGESVAGIGQPATPGAGDGGTMEPAAAAAAASAVSGSSDDKQEGNVGIVRLGSFAKGNIEPGPAPTEETGGTAEVGRDSDNNSTTNIIINNSTAAGAAEKNGVVSPARGIKMGKGGGTVQGGYPQLVRLGSFAMKHTRTGRVEHKLRKSQRHRRKAHHYLMSLTYRGLQPGMDYHIRVAGISSVGQVNMFSVYGRRTRTDDCVCVYKQQ